MVGNWLAANSRGIQVFFAAFPTQILRLAEALPPLTPILCPLTSDSKNQGYAHLVPLVGGKSFAAHEDAQAAGDV